MTAPDISRHDWLLMRCKGIGSSDASAACGESTKSPARLVLEKRGIMEPEDISNNESVILGKVMEPVIVSMIASRKGLRLLDPVLDRAMIERELERGGDTEVVGWVDGQQAFMRSVSRPWQHAAIDGIAIDEHAGLIDIEAKNVGGYHSRDWDPELGRAPAKFDCQVAHQLSVAPAFAGAYLGGIIGGNSLRVLGRSRADMASTMEALIALEERVWDCVQNGHMPSYDGSESHLRALRALHPKDTGEWVDLPEEALKWHEVLTVHSEIRAASDKRVKELRGKIEAAMNGATFGLLPDGSGMYSNRHQTRKEYTVAEASYPVLRFSRGVKP